LSEEQGSTGELGVLTPIKVLFAVAVGMAVLAFFGYFFVVSWLGVPWEIGMPLSVLAGLAMLAWSGGGWWRLASAGLWLAGLVWLVAWYVAR
jgi:hypothetical protein